MTVRRPPGCSTNSAARGPTVTNLGCHAGTTRNFFYEVFVGTEDCIAYGIGLAAGEFFAILEAKDGEGE